LLHGTEVFEVLIGDVEESVDFLIGTHAIILPEFLKELFFGGFVMVEAETAREQLIKFVLSCLEEVIVTSTHPLELILLNLGLPGSKFLLGGSQLAFKLDDGGSDGVELGSKLLILGFDFSASGGELVLVKTANISVETLDISLESEVQMGHLGELSV
jgi:hypothetical protein